MKRILVVAFIFTGAALGILCCESERDSQSFDKSSEKVPARTAGAERVDVGSLGDIHRFLSHRILPEGGVASIELAPATRTAP